MHLALTQQPHAERLQHIEVIDPEQFEIVLHLGEQPALDLHGLSSGRGTQAGTTSTFIPDLF